MCEAHGSFLVYIKQQVKPHPAHTFPLLPPRPLLRLLPHFRGALRHACPLFSIASFIPNSSLFFFNSPRNRKKSRGFQVLGIVGSLLTFDVGVIPTWRFLLIAIPSLVQMSHAEFVLGSSTMTSANDALPPQ